MPVTVYVDDEDDDETNRSTPAPRQTRRLLATKQISPSTASTSSVGSSATVTVPASAAAASSPTCVEVAIGDAVDDWTCAPSVQPGDRKLGHAGPITCRKPTYEVTIVPTVSGANEDPVSCVVVGATYDAGGSCPLDGVGDDASRLRGLSASSASIPATLAVSYTHLTLPTILLV